MLKEILDTENYRLYRHSSEFSSAVLAEGGLDSDRHAVFPQEKWEQLAKNGYSSLFVPESIGGAGLRLQSACAVVAGLARHCDDNGLLFSLGAHLFAGLAPIVRFGNNSWSTTVVEQVIKGKILCNAMTESESGSDAFAMKSVAEKKDTQYKIQASKTFISNAPVADYALFFVVTDKNKGAFGGISCFLIDAKHFSTGINQEKMGLRSSPMSELFVEEMIGEEMVLSEIGAGFMIFQHAMEVERIGLSAMHVGTMKRIFHETLQFAKQRKSQGKPLITHQSIAHKLAEMKTRIDASALMVFKAADLFDNQNISMQFASEVKLFVSESLQFCAFTAIQIHGGAGYVSGLIERFARDAHASTIYSGTSEIQKNVISACL